MCVQDCEERTGLPYINVSAGHQIRLADYSFGCEVSSNMVKCKGKRTLVSARQRWWYMAVSRCHPDVVNNGIDGMWLSYKLLMTNGDGIFFRHFSADEHCKLDSRFSKSEKLCTCFRVLVSHLVITNL